MREYRSSKECRATFVVSREVRKFIVLKVPGAQQGDEPGPTDEERMKAWEIGHPDYLGRDAFANIQKAIDEALH
uniref:Uncharacterized protein n=1 Tax=Parascaris equorum TaxID=6256 RepID=A0A914R9N9_PAREQ